MELFDIAEIGSESHEGIEAVKGSDRFTVVSGVLPGRHGDGRRDVVGGTNDLQGEPILLGVGQDFGKAVSGRDKCPTLLPDVEVAVISHFYSLRV